MDNAAWNQRPSDHAPHVGSVEIEGRIVAVELDPTPSQYDAATNYSWAAYADVACGEPLTPTEWDAIDELASEWAQAWDADREARVA